MKKIWLTISLLLVSSLGFLACSAQQPEDVVDDFFTAAQGFDLEAMEDCILEQEDGQERYDLDDLFDDEDGQYSKYFRTYLEDNAQKMTYDILESKTEGEQAIVQLDCRYIDGSQLLMRTFAESFAQLMDLAFRGIEPSEEEINEIFSRTMQEQSQSAQDTYLEKTIEVQLIRQENQWYIQDVTEEMLDVILSGFMSTARQIEEAF